MPDTAGHWRTDPVERLAEYVDSTQPQRESLAARRERLEQVPRQRPRELIAHHAAGRAGALELDDHLRALPVAGQARDQALGDRAEQARFLLARLLSFVRLLGVRGRRRCERAEREKNWRKQGDNGRSFHADQFLTSEMKPLKQ